jgi:hypothetical protein
MREVEKRLGDSDTGEGTRRTEGEIVKEFDSLLEKLRPRLVQAQGQPRNSQGQQGNQQQGNNPGNNPGLGMKGVIPPKNPKKKDKPQGPVVNNKDVWGVLPPELRDEMLNVFKEEPLPARDELVRRYYKAVAEKGVKKED